MTIINNSLAYSADTLVYNNECELLWPDYIDPYNPLNLPPNTVRVRTRDGLVPYKSGTESSSTYETATLVEGTSDVYDVYKSGTDFYNLFFNSNNVVEVLGANTTGITNMNSMFSYCSLLTTVALFDTSSVTDMCYMFHYCLALTSVPLFNTSSVTIMSYMFNNCNSLTTVPLFDTSSATDMECVFNNCYSLTTVPLFKTSNVENMYETFRGCSSLTSVPLFNTSSVMFMDSMFLNCTKVQSGALALYRQASTQANPPSSHTETFKNCGSDTTTGAAELAQIPDDWK